MNLTDWQYSLDGFAMAYVDGLTFEQALRVASMCESGEQYNIVIWATSRLQEIVDSQDPDRAGG